MKSLMRDRKIIGAFLGTVVEYYDYTLYGFAAAIIGAKFFAASDPLSTLYSSFGVYALAYVAKPLGALIFSAIGDRYGRKISLNITIIGIALPTLIIGMLPTYSEIGAVSTMVLVICRIIQGIFAAGEYDGAAIYVMEHFGPKYRFTASAITRSSGVLGLLLGIAMTNLCNSHIFPDWGWRIPFLLSLPFSGVALYYRKRFEETPEFISIRKIDSNPTAFGKLIRKQWINILMVIILAGGFGVTYQVSIIFMKQYLPLAMPPAHLFISTFSILLVGCFGLCMPISGVLADRFGQTPVIMVSLVFTVIASIGFMIAISWQMINLALVASLLLAISVAPFNALAHGIAIKAFPVDQRYRAIGLGHTIGSMLMTGPTGWVCVIFIQKYQMILFPVMCVMFFAILAAIVIVYFERRNKISELPLEGEML